jgi:hypothetical protein
MTSPPTYTSDAIAAVIVSKNSRAFEKMLASGLSADHLLLSSFLKNPKTGVATPKPLFFHAMDTLWQDGARLLVRYGAKTSHQGWGLFTRCIDAEDPFTLLELVRRDGWESTDPVTVMAWMEQQFKRNPEEGGRLARGLLDIGLPPEIFSSNGADDPIEPFSLRTLLHIEAQRRHLSGVLAEGTGSTPIRRL